MYLVRNATYNIHRVVDGFRIFIVCNLLYKAAICKFLPNDTNYTFYTGLMILKIDNDYFSVPIPRSKYTLVFQRLYIYKLLEKMSHMLCIGTTKIFGEFSNVTT